MVFVYRVQAADRGEVIRIAANALSLNGGTIKAAADNTTDAVLAHDAIAGGLTVEDSPGGVPTVSRCGHRLPLQVALRGHLLRAWGCFPGDWSSSTGLCG